MNPNPDIITKLKKYFAKRDDIVMAFLFGSCATGRTHLESDVDIAIYFKSDARGLWSEDLSEFPAESEIWSEIERILKKEVDLVVLNRAMPSVANAATRGVPIIIKDRNVYLNFLVRVVSEAIDMQEWVESYWQIKNGRSHADAARR